MRRDTARFRAVCSIFFTVLIAAQLAHAAAPSTKLSKLGPMVVQTVPDKLANDVDPALTAITVTFDQPMMDRNWSWTGGGDTYPKVDGQISYDAKKLTCTLPVKLEPGKAYWIGINSPSYKNFKAAGGKPAQRWLICFATKGADGKPTPIPADMQEGAKGIYESAGSEAPVVQKTMPKALDDKVPPGTSKVTVTFDQPMQNGSWSWTGGGETYPKVTSKPSYDASLKICTLPVKCEPGKVYWIGINSPSFQNFQNKANVPAKRYVILFATAGADGKATPIPKDMLKEAKLINDAFEPENNEGAESSGSATPAAPK